MNQAETFVGSLAVLMAVAAGVTAICPRHRLPPLRMINLVKDKFGEPTARVFLVVIASLMLISGVMILRDYRPRFAAPLTGATSNEASPHD